MSQMTQQSGGDNLKLILAGLLFLGACLAGVGIIPVIILLIGAAIAIKSNDISNVKVTTRFVQILLILSSITSIAFAIHIFVQNHVAESYGKYLSNSDLEIPPILAGVGLASLVFAYAIEEIWHKPIKRLLERRQAAPQQALTKSVDGPNIMARESLAPYSTADELLKWKRLRDEGVITEEEFSDARAKIMSAK